MGSFMGPTSSNNRSFSSKLAYWSSSFCLPTVFGISFGLAISACVHLAFWGLIANTTLPNPTRYRLEFVPMGTYHFIVLLWSYYLLVPHKVSAEPPPVRPDHNLALWNRELERLLKQ